MKLTTLSKSQLDDLAVVTGIWNASDSPSLRRRACEWPSLVSLVDQYRQMYRLADESDQLLGMARGAYRAVRALTCSPASPSSTVVGLDSLVSMCAAFIEDHPVHSVTLQIRELMAIAMTVLASPSPVQEHVERELGNYGMELEPPFKGHPAAVIIVPADLVDVTNIFLTDWDLVAEVRTPEQAKRHHYRGAIACGDLGTAYRNSGYVGLDTTVRRFGWIVTAPPADEVILVETLSVNNLSKMWLFGPTSHPDIEVASHISTGFNAHSLPILEPLARLLTPIDFSSSNERLVDTFQVLLATGRSVFFARGGDGPHPRTVIVGEGEVETKKVVPPEQLMVGDLLVIRVTGSEYEEIVRQADVYLLEGGMSQAEINEARAMVEELKACLRRSLETRGAPALVAELVRRGLPESYAKSLCRNLFSKRRMAPESKWFAQFVTTIGASYLVDKEPIFKTLRNAHRQAGSAITSDLNALLSLDLAWFDDLASSGSALVDGEMLGDLLIEMIAYLPEQGCEAPVTYLGRATEGNPPSLVDAVKMKKER